MRRAVVGLVAVLCALTAAAPARAGDDDRSWTTPVVRFEPQPGSTLVVEGVGELRGSVELRRTPGGLAVINDLPLEEYLLGLAEVPSTWPAAALEAQAIAARTFAVRSALTESSAPHKQAGADICATQACQVYDGVERERRDTGGAWAAAVRRTANRFLVWNGGPIMAKYASSNGGRSEPGGYPYLPAVDDPDDAATSPHARWRSVIPLDQVAAAVPGDGRLVEVNRAGDVVVLRRDRGDGTIVDQGMAPIDLRRALNADVPTPDGVPVPVPSHRFVARTEDGSLVLEGEGYGHLVGMSQYGALGKARRGMGADDILASYYGGLRSEAVDPARLPATIRVAVALDEPTATVRSTNGRFRVRAADGAAIAELTGGTWTADPAADGIQVVGPARATALRADRPAATLVRVALDVPARIVVQDTAARDLGVLDAGVHDLLVADVPVVAVQADAGGGRVERVELAQTPVAAAEASVAAPADVRVAAAPAGAGGGTTNPKLVPAVAAGVLAAAVVSCGARPRRRRPRPS